MEILNPLKAFFPPKSLIRRGREWKTKTVEFTTSKRHQIKSFLVICKSIYWRDYENVICTGSLSRLKLGQHDHYNIFPLVGGPLKVLPSVPVPARQKTLSCFPCRKISCGSSLRSEGWAVWWDGCDRLLLNLCKIRQTSGSVARSSEFKLIFLSLSKFP